MNDRIHMILRGLRLEPHPEGGHFRQVFKSARRVRPGVPRPERSALTAIYFLLVHGQCSRWHRVESDEIWTHLEGDGIELSCFDSETGALSRFILGPYARDAEPVRAVAAGIWQAARPLGDYSLAACMVGPGFEYDDFRMAADDPAASAAIRSFGVEYEVLL
jgi:uncharacterized protein